MQQQPDAIGFVVAMSAQQIT